LNIKKRLKNLQYRLIDKRKIGQDEHIDLIQEVREYIKTLEAKIEKFVGEDKSEE